MIVIIFVRILLCTFCLSSAGSSASGYRRPPKLLQLEPTRAAEKGTDAGERGAEEMEEDMLPCMLAYTRSRSPLHPFTRVGNLALCAILRGV